MPLISIRLISPLPPNPLNPLPPYLPRILAVMSGNKALVPYLCRDQILKVPRVAQHPIQTIPYKFD